jgi:tRNA-modifying protein YgfZ
MSFYHIEISDQLLLNSVVWPASNPRIYNRLVAATPTAELDAQYRLLREEAGLRPREERALLAIRGTEGAEFLQGQLTNDVEGLAPGEGCYAALLDRKGKMRADMRVLRRADDEVWIETSKATLDEIYRHLDMYRVGRDAEIARLQELAVLSVLGPRSSELLGGVPLGAEHSHRELSVAGHEVLLVSTDLGADLIGSDEALAAIAAELEAAGAETVTAAAAEILRVESGRPAFGAEMGNDTIPQEAGINERAVDFEKGCYVGQETVARLHYRGKPNRHLRRLSSSEELAAGEPVRLGERELGTVGTAVLSPARGPLALAILRREAEPGAEVVVGDDKRAVVEELEA